MSRCCELSLSRVVVVDVVTLICCYCCCCCFVNVRTRLMAIGLVCLHCFFFHELKCVWVYFLALLLLYALVNGTDGADGAGVGGI